MSSLLRVEQMNVKERGTLTHRGSEQLVFTKKLGTLQNH